MHLLKTERCRGDLASEHTKNKNKPITGKINDADMVEALKIRSNNADVEFQKLIRNCVARNSRRDNSCYKFEKPGHQLYLKWLNKLDIDKTYELAAFGKVS